MNERQHVQKQVIFKLLISQIHSKEGKPIFRETSVHFMVESYEILKNCTRYLFD